MNRKFKKIKKKNLGSYPYFSVVLSTTLALFVIGLFGLLFFHSQKLSEILKDKFEVHAYLDKDLSQEQTDSIRAAIAANAFVLQKENQAQVFYISQEQAAKQFINETGEDFYKVLGENPLHPSFIIKIDHSFADKEHLKEIKARISTIKGVFEVDYKENLISQINKNIKSISYILVLFSIILLIASMLLINNTIRLAFFSQRFLIRSMQLVGAKKSFIRKPFLSRALLHGFLSGLFAAAMLFLLLRFLYSKMPELKMLSNSEHTAMVLGGIIIFGIFIAAYSSLTAVNKYLKMSLDELY